MILHAWYSPKMAEFYGGFVYARADGSEIVITSATKTREYAPGWDDMENRGEVVKFVRRIDTGGQSWR